MACNGLKFDHTSISLCQRQIDFHVVAYHVRGNGFRSVLNNINKGISKDKKQPFIGDHSFSTCAKFSEKLTNGCVRIRWARNVRF